MYKCMNNTNFLYKNYEMFLHILFVLTILYILFCNDLHISLIKKINMKKKCRPKLVTINHRYEPKIKKLNQI